MKNKELTIQDINKVRGNDGFPIGTDEDIIALSDSPYYTACPNPFIEEFIKDYGTPYDEDTDDYHREPFAADVSEGKTDPIYMAHTYHTKVPHKAIMNYILHYTNPGDIIYDGFCGTGMTALAAQMCGVESQVRAFKDAVIGERRAIIGDLSPVATFIAHNYTNSVDLLEYTRVAKRLFEECRKEFDWMYKTTHNDGNAGIINYVVWSDVFICPTCGEEFVFWDVAVGDDKRVKNPFFCPKCRAELRKSNCSRKQEVVADNCSDKTISQATQVPVLINYEYEGKKYEKKPDKNDIKVIEQVKELLKKYSAPHDELPTGDNTAQPKQSHGYNRVNQFYFDRSAIVFSSIIEKSKKTSYSAPLLFLATSILTKTGSKLHNIGFKDGKINLAGAMPNVLYVPSTVAERNIIALLESKLADICKVYTEKRDKRNVMIQTCSATDTGIPENSIDYIFTDPPFGANINYSEMNYIWEAWLKVKTNNDKEAIMNRAQGKGLKDYQLLMQESFNEYYRVLKPGRWMTVEFHNSLNSVWNAIQEALQRAGFIIADVRILDKQQGTFKQMTSSSAVKKDLVISAYKPRIKLKKSIESHLGTEETAWDFVRQHLLNLPVVVDSDGNGKIDVLTERQSHLLFDRMIAYHVINGIPVPVDANSFYLGLNEHFLERDKMFFLPDQVNEYDKARLEMEVEDMQFELFVTNEKTAITWLYQQLSDEFGGSKTYAEIQPKFMQEVKSVDRYESMPELSVLLEENFLEDDKGRWYIPDVKKEGDVAKLREKRLWKEFEGYLNSKGKLKLFRSEAIRAGFARLWKDKKYKAIVDLAERLPEQTIQEDPNLLMYYDISLGRI